MDAITTREVDPEALSADQRETLIDELYLVQRDVFDGVDRADFARYVVNSPAEQSWIDVSRDASGKAVAYIALHRFDRELNGQPSAIFRAEAGTMRAYRGKAPVAPIFLRRALPYALMRPLKKTFYLGSLVHPSSYHAFARFAAEIWPRADKEVPPALHAFMCQLGDEFGLSVVDPERPLVREVGWITRDSEMERAYWRSCEKPTVAFFLKANPGYHRGDGLITLMDMGPRALLASVRSYMVSRLRQRLMEAHVLLQRLPGFRPKVTLRDMRAFLRAEAFLREIGAVILDKLQSQTEILIQSRGRYIFRQGDRGDAMYVVLEGSCYVLLGEGPEEIVVDQIFDGQAFGEMALLTGQPRTASVRTATACKLLRLSSEALDRIIEESPDSADQLWNLFNRRTFDLHLKEMPRYEHLRIADRAEWFDAAAPMVMEPDEPVLVEGPRVVFLARGSVEVHQADNWLTVAAPSIMEVSGSLELRADKPVKVFSLPTWEAMEQTD